MPAPSAARNDGDHKPDRIFSASGQAGNASVTEWRRGAHARIGLDIESGELVRQVWAFVDQRASGNRVCAILGLPHSTLVIRLSPDMSSVEDPDTYDDGFDDGFDTSSRTLHVAQLPDNIIIQVTENGVTLKRGPER